ncbi:MAG TPA: SURF1 family protein [Steroidobacteraceae bacterium]
MPLQISRGSRQFKAPWGMVAAALLVTLVFIHLGRWQWYRAEYKRALAAAFVNDAGRVTALGSRPLAQLLRYTHVQAEGLYDSAHQFLLDNMTRDGRVGYEVLTPLTLVDGRVVLVNRCWLPLPAEGRARLPNVSFVALPDVTVTGKIDELPVTGLAMGRAPPDGGPNWPKRTSFPDSAQLAASLGRPLEGRQLLLDADQPQGYRRDWKPASAGFGPERHLAYAIQWWGLAALTLFLLIFLNLKKRQP